MAVNPLRKPSSRMACDVVALSEALFAKCKALGFDVSVELVLDVGRCDGEPPVPFTASNFHRYGYVCPGGFTGPGSGATMDSMDHGGRGSPTLASPDSGGSSSSSLRSCTWACSGPGATFLTHTHAYIGLHTTHVREGRRASSLMADSATSPCTALLPCSMRMACMRASLSRALNRCLNRCSSCRRNHFLRHRNTCFRASSRCAQR